jgi:hypothetical protein
MTRRNHASFFRNIAFGVLLASMFTLLACGARNMPGGGMAGQTSAPAPSPNPPSSMSHSRPHP